MLSCNDIFLMWETKFTLGIVSECFLHWVWEEKLYIHSYAVAVFSLLFVRQRRAASKNMKLLLPYTELLVWKHCVSPCGGSLAYMRGGSMHLQDWGEAGGRVANCYVFSPWNTPSGAWQTQSISQRGLHNSDKQKSCVFVCFFFFIKVIYFWWGIWSGRFLFCFVFLLLCVRVIHLFTLSAAFQPQS